MCYEYTQCMQNSCQSRNGTLTIITDIVADKGGYIHTLLEWTQVTYSYTIGYGQHSCSVKSEITAAYFNMKSIQLLMVLCERYVFDYYYTYKLAHTGFSGLYYAQR